MRAPERQDELKDWIWVSRGWEREQGRDGTVEEERVLGLEAEVRAEDHVVSSVAVACGAPVEPFDRDIVPNDDRIQFDVVLQVGQRVRVEVAQDDAGGVVRAKEDCRGGQTDEARSASQLENCERFAGWGREGKEGEGGKGEQAGEQSRGTPGAEPSAVG